MCRRLFRCCALQFAAAHLGSPAPQGMPPVPFVLIQGPPGTGKTHTVKGVLNVWHLVRRFTRSLLVSDVKTPCGRSRAC